MEGHFPATREELYHVQMDLQHTQSLTTDHGDRILRLEKRQADDAALKSVWNSPFPSVLSGTPQQRGTIVAPSGDVFDDFEDDNGQHLLGSLHLEEEPVRRGASRANSVRFDVSAMQGSNWAEDSRSSGDFGPIRPSSGIGSHPMTERSLSHKSDGRHSSAGHSVHSASGRNSSLGLDTNFMIGGQDDDSSLAMPAPPPGLFVLGTVPSIIRCWLNETFSHSALLYAVVSTGSQKSLLEHSLVKELDLLHLVRQTPSGENLIRLPVYLPEAIITQPTSRANSPAPQLPTLTATFSVVDQRQAGESRKRIRVFLGSDTLRAHSADLLFSQNLMTLYGDDRNRLSVPFVRPEDDALFKNILTLNVLPEKIELKATALPFTPTESKASEAASLSEPATALSVVSGQPVQLKSTEETPLRCVPFSTSGLDASGKEISREETLHDLNRSNATSTKILSEGDCDLVEINGDDSQVVSKSAREPSEAHTTSTSDRRGSSSGIWGSWRSGGVPGNESDHVQDTSRSARGGRSMKVLKPSKLLQSSRSSGSRVSAAYELPPSRFSGESRRKSQGGQTENVAPIRWESKRHLSDEKMAKEPPRLVGSVPRSSNPVGGASAFAWMKSGNQKQTTTAE